jgi:pyruvate dehydrogenase E1 component
LEAVTGVQTCALPIFYIFYSQFGLQRVGDLVWAAGDIQARGFSLRSYSASNA